jgi:rod shape-determining protein MreC
MANGTWKIARGKGSAQLPLAIFAILAVGLVVLGKAQSSLFDRAHVFYSDSIAPLLKSVGQPLDGAGKWFDGIDGLFNLYQENLRLKQENARLRQWQSAALVLESRVQRYQLLLNAVPDPAIDAIAARVIGRDNRPFLDTLILDAGHSRGVKPGEAVVDARGMIGRVFLAGDHTSWVILLTDLNSRVPVVIEPGNIQAIMAGDNSGAPAVEPMAQGAAIKEGGQVVTSGDGGLLPNGLPVGSVVWDGSAFRVALLADAATADDVRIVDLKQPPEQPPAVTPGDLPAAAAGLPPLAHAAAAPMTNTVGAQPQNPPPSSAPPAAQTAVPAAVQHGPAVPAQQQKDDDATDDHTDQ